MIPTGFLSRPARERLPSSPAGFSFGQDDPECGRRGTIVLDSEPPELPVGFKYHGLSCNAELQSSFLHCVPIIHCMYQVRCWGDSSFIQHLLDIYYVSGTVMGAEGPWMRKDAVLPSGISG